MNKWTTTTGWSTSPRSEIAGFLALLILMADVVKPELGQYWSTDPYLHTPVLPAIMPRDRFKEILKNLHFSDSYIADGEDRLRNSEINGLTIRKVQKLLQSIRIYFSSRVLVEIQRTAKVSSVQSGQKGKNRDKSLQTLPEQRDMSRLHIRIHDVHWRR